MITITDRQYNVLCQLSYDLPQGLLAYDDWFQQDLDTGVSTFEFTVDKTHSEVAYLRSGHYVLALDEDTLKTFEIMTVEEDNDSKLVYCEDAGLDLLGEQVGAYQATASYPITHYIEQFTYDSGWEIGHNDVPNTTVRKLEWEGIDTATKRLRELARRFNVEISYSVELRNDRVFRKLINIYRRIGRDNKVRLEYGIEVAKIKKTESIENLATGLIGIGQSENSDKPLTLKGYPFKETERYKLVDGMLLDKIEGRRWSRHNSDTAGYIVKYYESEAKSQKTLCDETLNQLKKRAYPEVTYEVDIDSLPETVNIGDSVVIVDHDYKPAILLEARVQTIKRSFSDKTKGTITVSNIVEQPDTLDEKVKRLSSLLQEKLFNWQNVPVQIELVSSNGTIFKDSNIQTTLSATLFKHGLDVTNEYTQFKWKRVSPYNQQADEQWNNRNINSGSSIVITEEDVDREATFSCEVWKENTLIVQKEIVLKDFIVGRYKQSTPPQNASDGALWTDTSRAPHELKVLKDGQWLPVVQDLTSLREEYSQEMDRVVNDITSIQTLLETKLTEKDLEDLNGKYADLKTGYENIKNKAQEIEGLGQRVTAYEVNVQQSQMLINALATHFSFSEDGLLIGKDGSSLQMVQTNEKLSFLDGGKEVAYISNQQMYILSGVFVESLIVANHKIEKLRTKYTVFNYVGGAR